MQDLIQKHLLVVYQVRKNGIYDGLDTKDETHKKLSKQSDRKVPFNSHMKDLLGR